MVRTANLYRRARNEASYNNVQLRGHYMNAFRTLTIAAAAMLLAACASTPSEPAPSGAAAPAAKTTATDITGTWALSIETPMGARDSTMTAKQSGESFAGTIGGAQGTRDIQGTVKGKDINFAMDVEVQGNALHIEYAGVVEGDTMKGTVKFGDFGEGSWTGKKQN